MGNNEDIQLNQNAKTVVAIWHGGGKGKSGTLREFAKLLIAAYPSYTSIFPIPTLIPSTGDFRCIVKINGKVYGIESQGDPGTGLKKRLFELADIYNCDVILCSTRTRGETVYAVNDLCKVKGYDDIWTSTYQVNNRANHYTVNCLKAKHLLELLQGLSLI